MRIRDKILPAFLIFILIISGGYSYKTYTENVKKQELILKEIKKYKAQTNKINKRFKKALRKLQKQKLSTKEFKKTIKELVDQLSVLLDAIDDNNSDNYNILKKDIISLGVHFKTLLSYLKTLEKDLKNIKPSEILDIGLLYEKTLYPTTRIIIHSKVKSYKLVQGKLKEFWTRSIYSSGSGTIIYSKQNKLGKIETYILTCQHFVRNFVNSKTIILDKIVVQVFDYKGNYTYKNAKIIRSTPYVGGKDIMVLKLEDEINIYKVVSFISREEIKKLKIFTPILNVGAGLGRRPYPSLGYITAKYTEKISAKFLWQSSAQAIFGNSGGGIFLQDNGKQIGIFVRLGRIRFQTITHQAFFINPVTIWDWMESEKLDYLLKE